MGEFFFSLSSLIDWPHKRMDGPDYTLPHRRAAVAGVPQIREFPSSGSWETRCSLAAGDRRDRSAARSFLDLKHRPLGAW